MPRRKALHWWIEGAKEISKAQSAHHAFERAHEHANQHFFLHACAHFALMGLALHERQPKESVRQLWLMICAPSATVVLRFNRFVGRSHS